LTAITSEEVLPFDRRAGELAGQMADELERTGQPIGLTDPMIAAIALRHRPDRMTFPSQRIPTFGTTKYRAPFM
jgi:predicted nucleic acid-binding protein